MCQKCDALFGFLAFGNASFTMTATRYFGSPSHLDDNAPRGLNMPVAPRPNFYFDSLV